MTRAEGLLLLVGARLPIAVVLLLALPGPGLTTNYGAPRDSGKHCDTTKSSQCMADNWNHGITFQNIADPDLQAATTFSMTNYNQVMDNEIYMFEAIESLADVLVRDGDWGANGAWAWTACHTTLTGEGGSETPLPGTKWCKPQVFRWNAYYEPGSYPGTTAKRDIACEELGHTMGLRHRSTEASCMVSPSTTYTTTSLHDRDHLIALYP